MVIHMQKGNRPDDFIFPRWDVALVGPAVDDRGKAAVDFAEQNSSEILLLQYDESTFEMTVGDQRINAEDIGDALNVFVGGKVLLEATTLGLVEIFMACRGLRANGLQQMSLVYIEPLSYLAPRRIHVLDKRDFELSDTVPGYRAIPGATFLLSVFKAQHVVFFLGYEDHRFDVAMEDFQQTLRSQDCSVVFGVPAFQPGWEMNSFANNVRVIRGRDVSGGIHFCGAENPSAALDVLTEIQASLVPGTRMFVAPIGTKPMGVATALFAAENPDVGLLYDHPKRRAGRSSSCSSWHLYEIKF
jgi:hypothetical protein